MAHLRPGHVLLGNDDEEGHLESQSQSQMLARRPHHARVAADDEHDVVRRVGRQPADGRPQILVVARQIDERQQLAAVVADLLRC